MSLASLQNAIDRLTATLRGIETDIAYREQRNTLSYNGVSPTTWITTTYKGKYFPHGAKGFIQNLGIYARNSGASDSTITLGVAPQPESTEQFTVTITVPAGSSAGWFTGTAGVMWNFWEMFIYVKSISGAAEYAYDTAEVTDAEPEASADGYTSSDSGTNWSGEDSRRYWFRAGMYGQFLGGLSVGGHVTIREIESFLRVVLTDESGNITGVGLPLYATTIIGSDEIVFNSMADGTEVSKTYVVGRS